MDVHTTVAEFRAARCGLAGSLGLVPTMGYLHEGHLALVRRARAENDILVVTIFVNPTQFGPSEDFAAYPRDVDRDLELLRIERVDHVFAPGLEEVYAPGHDTWVDPGQMATRLEGEHRPGHFRGVATVVAKLFNIVRPHRAYFGQKDGQQVVVIQKLARDLDMGLEVVVMPTIREPDGLAMSSRNVQLSADQRQAASVVHQALRRAYQLWTGCERNGDVLREAASQILRAEPMVDSIDYVSVAAMSTLDESGYVDGRAMVSVAVHMGAVRLIDNIVFE